ncbi:hypothetical protein GQS_10510 [Thermococcus sp. 4557]|uniref:hypothetical protein n=1 Tax=Thermococcus sp. (strain CGMCC 1.5172 / 4557) TaxID=1042877 RepID=UPI000219EB97|nr:hypothetical protein [Thermococcus sp. 4557]AEK73995.1 hypothetical protein GQS_10510 [Thermococcus sp. 4557]
MDEITLAALLIMISIPYFGIYPAYLFRRGRLSASSLAVYISFTLSMVFMAIGAVFDSLPLVLLSFTALIVTGLLAYLSRKKLEEDAYSVEVDPDEHFRPEWLVRLDATFSVWLAYRLGSTRAALLNVLLTYVTVVGVIALMNHSFGGHFPLKSFAALYAVVMVFQFRGAYRRLYEKTGID